MEDPEIVFDPLPPDALRQFIVNRLAAFGIARTGVDAWQPIGFFLKSGQGEWQGGLLGGAWGGWMSMTVPLGGRGGARPAARVKADGRGRGAMRSVMVVSLPTWTPTATRLSASTRSVATRFSAASRTFRPATRSISCASGSSNPDLRARRRSAIVPPPATNMKGGDPVSHCLFVAPFAVAWISDARVAV